MTLSAVVTRYANALADVVTAGGAALRPEAALAELRAFEQVVRQSPELQTAFGTPAVPAARKRSVIRRIAEVMKLSKVTQNFLFVLADRGRIGSLGAMVKAFEEALDERMGIVRAEIASAGDLNERQREELTAELERLTGHGIRAAFAVDPSLIGGAIAKVGSLVYDGSVRGSLESLGRRLSEEE